MAEKLLIVGGGLSGLYLALLLEDIYEVTILEARDRLGGRIFSIDGHDMGPSWIWSHHKNMLTLVNDLNLELFPQYNTGYALYDTKDKIELFNPPPSQPSARMSGSLTLLIDKLAQRLKCTKIILDEKVKSLEDLGDEVKVQTDNASYLAHKVIVTLPPRLSANLSFIPALSSEQYLKLSQTQTWMGNSAKCVIEFKTAFWREKDLSGFVFSNQGPLSEIHDASTKEVAALFGFVSSQADMKNLERDIRTQCKRVFGIDDEEIVKIHLLDWRKEVFTSTHEDSLALIEHPRYGIDLSHHNKKVLFSSTEFSFEEGGYLEGAILRAKEVAKILKKSN